MVASIALGFGGKGLFRGSQALGVPLPPRARDPLYCRHRQFCCIAFTEPPGHRDPHSQHAPEPARRHIGQPRFPKDKFDRIGASYSAPEAAGHSTHTEPPRASAQTAHAPRRERLALTVVA